MAEQPAIALAQAAVEQSTSQPASQPAQSAQATPSLTAAFNVASLSASDSQRCMWEGCADRFGSAEELYEHICGIHIGRKSTNNLQLVCRWSNCNTTTVKRDHITSHVRVHVPFKPHRCPVCGKAFKRPQDLKKHHKTHADEGAQGQNGHGQGPSGHSGGHGPNGYGGLNGQPGGSFYGGAGMHTGVGMNFPYAGQPNGGYYHQPTTMSNNYGGVYYNVDSGGPQLSYRRDDDLHALNNLFGALKQPNFNSASYPQFSSALSQAHGVILPPPIAPHNMDYTSAIEASYPSPLPQLSNVRSKADLILLQDRLQKMMQAIDAHDRTQAIAAQANFDHHARTSLSVQSHEQTPDLTPGTSVMSYSPGHSPPADHSPVSSTGAPSYPHLQGSFAMSAVPTLGNQYDASMSHRHSGGRLQRAQPASAHEETAASRAVKVKRDVDPNLDPALAVTSGASSTASEGSPTPQPESPAVSDEQTAVQRDSRIVTDLLSYVKSLIDNEQYEKGTSTSPEASSDAPGPVESDDMEIDTKPEHEAEESLYPTLPS